MTPDQQQLIAFIRQGIAQDRPWADPFDASGCHADVIDGPEWWTAVPIERFIAWFAGGGRLAKIEAFIEQTAAATDPQTVGLRSAARVALMSLNNTKTSVEMRPGSEQRVLVDGLLAAGVLSVEDRQSLADRARPDDWQEPTVQDVQDAYDALSEADAGDALTTRLDAARNAAAALGTSASDADRVTAFATSLGVDLGGVL